MCCNAFLQRPSSNVVSGDKMMNKALGPVWHTTQKAPGIIPEGLRGLDQEATWRKRHSDGWVYGHGSFCVVSHRPCVLGAFKYMRNSANEAKRLWWETGQLRGLVTTVIVDGKADDQALFAEFQRQRKMTLLTTPRKHSDPTEARQRMIQVLNLPIHRTLRQQRGQTVEPRQGVSKDIFALDWCWMRGHRNNRWLFAAMGVAVQLHQARALKAHRSTWKIKQEVLGL
jgi:hypothetical protein